MGSAALDPIILFAVAVATPPAPPPNNRPIVVVETPALNRPMTRNAAMTPSQALRRGMVRLRPEEAVIKAAQADVAGIVAVYEVDVVRANEVGKDIFLGTQEDYRDQRNLAIAIRPSAFKQLMTRHGAPLAEKLKGRKLLVGGRARPVRIALTEDGKPTGKYYYQTHVVVTHANQIEVIGE
jgi:hypothetical protein